MWRAFAIQVKSCFPLLLAFMGKKWIVVWPSTSYFLLCQFNASIMEFLKLFLYLHKIISPTGCFSCLNWLGFFPNLLVLSYWLLFRFELAWLLSQFISHFLLAAFPV